MSIPEPLNHNVINARRLARKFTPNTPCHDPHLDPNVPKEDHHLVPTALFAGKKLNRELPRPAVANLHVMLKLTTEPDELLKEFHDKIPRISDVLGAWSEVKGASPTTTSEVQLEARAVADDQVWTSTNADNGTTLNLVSNLDTPGRADAIFLTDATGDNGQPDKDSGIPSNLRTLEWLGFDGSYVHLKDSEPKKADLPTKRDVECDEHSARRNSTPSNLMTTESLDDWQYTDLPIEAYSSEPKSDAGNTSRETGPYEEFWMNHMGHNSR